MKDIITFFCDVSCKVPYEDRFENYTDEGIIILPESYSETGEPSRLVISCHGAGGTVETDDSQVCYQVLTKYLLANGFAVMDMAGLPVEYCSKYGIDRFNNIGAPLAVDAYVSGYEWCVSHYNLKKEALIHGASMGGISSTNVVLSGRIPLLIQTGFCPVLDTYNEIFLHPWSDGLSKIALEKMYSLKDGVYDESRIAPFNPMTNEKTKNYPVPVRFWQCADDIVVSVDVTKRFVGIVNSNGGDARLTVLPAGGHEPQLYGPPVGDPSGITVYRGETLEITEAVEGVFRALNEYR
ncbi:MAG: hypothetical protein IKX86_05425 [Clostridia bacterium]|nr:hypothetical protein [Clostridia bacterium]